jgi:uncharacterized protein YkwD
MLLIAAVIPHTAAPQRQLIAQSASIIQLPVAGAVSVASTRRLATPTPVPTPRPQKRVVATRVVPVKPKPAPAVKAPIRAAVGTGQWGLINQDRAAAGLPPLQWNDCLARVAQGQAARMAAQGYISHANGRTLDLACHLGNRASESIGVQWGSINDAAMNAWFMGDPIHRDNIMGPYHWVGVAWVWGANREAYLAIEFG